MAEPAWKRNTSGDLKFKYPSFVEESPAALADKQPPPGSKPERKYLAAPQEQRAPAPMSSDSASGGGREPPPSRRDPSLAFTPPRGSGLPLPTPPRTGGGMFSCCFGSRNAREEFHHQVVSVTLSKLEKIAATQASVQQQQEAMGQQLAAVTSRLDRIIGGNAEVAQMLRTDRAVQRGPAPAAAAGSSHSRANPPASRYDSPPSGSSYNRAPSSVAGSDAGMSDTWEAIERRADGLHAAVDTLNSSLPGQPAASDYAAAPPLPDPAALDSALVPYSEDATLSEWEKIEARVNAGADDAKHKASAFGAILIHFWSRFRNLFGSRFGLILCSLTMAQIRRTRDSQS